MSNAEKKFLTLSPDVNVVELFLTNGPNKVECVSLANLYASSNVFRLGKEPTQGGIANKGLHLGSP